MAGDSMPNDHGGSARFSVSPIQGGGPFHVLDDVKGKRLIASCPSMDLAMTVAALMNGNPEAAMERRRAIISVLDRGL